MLAGVAAAHPGRLDVKGCHQVHTRWEAKDGTVYEPGTYHCHRALGEMKLDGQERLQDPDEKPAEPPLQLPPRTPRPR